MRLVEKSGKLARGDKVNFFVLSVVELTELPDIDHAHLSHEVLNTTLTPSTRECHGYWQHERVLIGGSRSHNISDSYVTDHHGGDGGGGGVQRADGMSSLLAYREYCKYNRVSVGESHGGTERPGGCVLSQAPRGCRVCLCRTVAGWTTRSTGSFGVCSL
ncbi:hypothetical protein RRG08_051254 [Elysia crispata]|uniref:Uncharacterized protein n=1 Tax=Elysia crispata TaxID=231223 RepID=A0AAE1A666_9GAST|nr:hypothetical protein RRG08_051254 [Elysia crispata]